MKVKERVGKPTDPLPPDLRLTILKPTKKSPVKFFNHQSS